MKLLTYLRDKWILLLAQGIVLLLIPFFFSVMGVGWEASLFVTAVAAAAFGIAAALDYMRRRLFYAQVQENLERLDRKSLLSEMLDEPAFAEGKILCGVLRTCNKSMNDEIAVYRRNEAEHREYVETWMHEIKTPIASLRLLLENNPGPLAESAAEELDRIDGLLEQTLFYSRSNCVEKDYRIRAVSLGDLVSAVVRRNSRDFIGKHLALEREGLDRIVYTDTKWGEFILNQLLSNAVKYSAPGGMIRFSAREDAQFITLCVEDQGAGISAEDLPRVLEKGFTGENGRLYGKSTGMGLYLCKKLCDKLGLSISVQSCKGSGTAVTVVFPKSEMHSVVRDLS